MEPTTSRRHDPTFATLAAAFTAYARSQPVRVSRLLIRDAFVALAALAADDVLDDATDERCASYFVLKK